MSLPNLKNNKKVGANRTDFSKDMISSQDLIHEVVSSGGELIDYELTGLIFVPKRKVQQQREFQAYHINHKWKWLVQKI